MLLIICFFFFSSRRRHTRSYGDWSSDVCSSDLALRDQAKRRRLLRPADDVAHGDLSAAAKLLPDRRREGTLIRVRSERLGEVLQIGRASCRERVEVSVAAGALKIN